MGQQIYKAIVVHPKSGNQEEYTFPAEQGLFDKPRKHLVQAFSEYVDKALIPEEHVEIDAQSILKDTDHRILTILGQMHTEHGDIPMMAMISEAEE